LQIAKNFYIFSCTTRLVVAHQVLSSTSGFAWLDLELGVGSSSSLEIEGEQRR